MRIKANELTQAVEPIPVEMPQGEPERIEETKPKKKRIETSKLIVWVCLLNGFLWVWCSYILAWLDKVQIAESLSQVAVTEIIGVVLAYCLKSAVENLSKNNNWPDKNNSNSSGLG